MIKFQIDGFKVNVLEACKLDNIRLTSKQYSELLLCTNEDACMQWTKRFYSLAMFLRENNTYFGELLTIWQNIINAAFELYKLDKERIEDGYAPVITGNIATITAMQAFVLSGQHKILVA